MNKNTLAGKIVSINLMVLNREVVVEIEITRVGNTGIGPYEYWGQRCFDLGRVQVEDYKILSIKYEDGTEVESSLKRVILANDEISEKLDEAVLED